MAFIGLPAVSHAQAASGPFADVPTDHWAYQSVDTLQKAGIVIGYPDGTYGGRRPMTRYEFAVAIARLLAQINGKNGGATAEDMANLRTDLTNRIQGNTDAIDALKTLVNGFQPELTRLGQDVAAINARLDALESRVSALDNRLTKDEGVLGSVVDEQRRFKVTGEVSTIFEAVNSKHRDASGNFAPFLDKNGNRQGLTGFGNPNYAVNGHLLQSSDVYEDVLLHLRGRLSDTATANVDLDFGNYLNAVGNAANFGQNALPGGFLGSNVSHGAGGFSGFGGTDNIYKAYLDAAVKLGPLGGAELLVGRFGNQYTPYTLKLADADIYTNLTQTDSGDLIGDGAGINLKLGPVKLNGFAVKLDQNPFTQPFGGSVGSVTPGNPFGSGQSRPGGLIVANHAAQLSQGIGARATIGAPEAAVLGFTVEQFALTNTTAGSSSPTSFGPFDGVNDPNRTGNNSQYNRLSVYGVDFNGALPFGLPGVKKGGLLVDASYTVSAHGRNDHFNDVGKDFRYQATDDQLAFAIGGLQLKGGYQYIGPNFSAPGYWGKVGSWTNPTNVRGAVASVKYAFTPKLGLNADYEAYKAAYGRDGQGNFVNSPLQQNDHLNRYQVGLTYGLSSAYGVDLGYENVQYDLRNNNGTLQAAGKPRETYVTFGIGHSVSNNASIKLLYQVVHYEDRGTGFDQTASANGNNGKQDGGIATAQFQLKF
ncbi:MAG: S-layer homology domain-containing protein [Acidobacteriales bacterium]|nr:S-layer homology domain-containing protein [Terriglobales bacterium]